MNDTIKQSIVGIRAKSEPDQKYTYAGTGFVVYGGLIVTCAHVVHQADQRDNVVRFQFEDGDKHIKTATVAKIDDHLDIAILTPAEPLENAQSLRLMYSSQSRGNKFSAFGYPQKGMFQGLYGAGEIRGLVKDKHKRDALQVASEEVTYGYSGGPVWDDALEAVVGMISRGLDPDLKLDDKLGSAGFAIPCETLKAFYPDLVVGEAPAPPPPVTWNLKHPYGMPPNFTGRVKEQAALSTWLNDDRKHPFLIVRALGGFGKSALAWHWLTHKVDHDRWPYVVWWSFYEGDASFDSFITETLTYLLGDKAELPTGTRLQAERLLKELRQRNNVLLIMDGAERLLRAFSGMGAAYQGDSDFPLPAGEGRAERGVREKTTNDLDCVSPTAEYFLHAITSLSRQMYSKVLMTTRLRPRIVEKHGALLAGCAEHELTALAPEDAVTFFQLQGIKGTHTEIEAACAPYGYHPLSLRLLAGITVSDFKHPNDIRAAQGLDITGDLVQRQHHVLEHAYNTLPPAQQTLLSRIACFRSGVMYDTLKALADQPEKDFEAALRALISRGLLQRHQSPPTNNKPSITIYDLHPIVRRYVYNQLKTKKKFHRNAVKYFRKQIKLDFWSSVYRDFILMLQSEVTSEKTKKHLSSLISDHMLTPENITRLKSINDFAPLIELYHHMVCSGQSDEAFNLFYTYLQPLYFLGAYQTVVALLSSLFTGDKSNLPHLKNKYRQAWVMNSLAIALKDQPQYAMHLLRQKDAIHKQLFDMPNLAIGHGNLASIQIITGALQDAKKNLLSRKKIAGNFLFKFLWGYWQEIRSHQELGLLFSILGQWDKAEQEFEAAQYKQEQHQSGITAMNRAHSTLLLARSNNKSPVPNIFQVAISFANTALLIIEKDSYSSYPHEAEFTNVHWLLGTSLRAVGQLAESERHLTEALQRCRATNNVESEADILLDMARLRLAQGNSVEALRLAEEALTITERCGYVLQGADVHLFLATLVLTPNPAPMGSGEPASNSNASPVPPTTLAQSGPSPLPLGEGRAERGVRALALQHAREALRLATCDGGDYTYKVAYDEAQALLKQLGEDSIKDDGR